MLVPPFFPDHLFFGWHVEVEFDVLALSTAIRLRLQGRLS